MEDVSCLVTYILDNMGYNQQIINVRRKFWRKFQRSLNTQLYHRGVRKIIAGSKAEGITSISESDVDAMCLLNDVMCTDKPRESDIPVLYTDTSNTPHGYTRLQVKRSDNVVFEHLIGESLFESESQDIYVSSAFFASHKGRLIRRIGGAVRFDVLSGPAVPMEGLKSGTKIDCVVALPCNHSKLLQTWKSRRRLYNWPPADVREAAASKLPQVVPVGSKGSTDHWREWRFCFIESELLLIYSLNDTQIKLYIVLKMVAKDILQNVCSEITSYIMKNIVFWLSELLPEAVFKKENLLSLLLLSLRFLNSSIKERNWLPYYMIPGRNLLAERLTPDSRRQLSSLIETITAEGPWLLLRCTKLQTAVTVILFKPTLFVKHGENKTRKEKMAFSKTLKK